MKTMKTNVSIGGIIVLLMALMICISSIGKAIISPDGAKQVIAASNGGAGTKYCFPRPDYDSGWVAVSPGGIKHLTHNLGGYADDYVIDMQAKSSMGLSSTNKGYGRDMAYIDSIEEWGYYYLNLSSNNISIARGKDDSSANLIRVRIWIYECGEGSSCCDQQYIPGDYVQLFVDNPRGAVGLMAGTLGRVICCDSTDPELPIFVSWNNWTNGRNTDEYCDSSVWPYPANSGWWMSCDQIKPAVLMDSPE
jgi:hypothetical protein